MFPIFLRVLTIAGTCVVAGLLTRAYVQRKNELEDGAGGEQDALRSIGSSSNSETNSRSSGSSKADSSVKQESSSKQDTKPSKSSSSENGGNGNGGSGAPKVDERKSRQDQATSPYLGSKETEPTKSQQDGTAAPGHAASASVKKQVDNTAPLSEAVTRVEGKAESEKSAIDLASARLKFSDDLTNKLDQIDAMVSKAEPELDGPYCRAASLKAFMDALDKVREMKDTREELQSNGSPELWRKTLNETDTILTMLNTTYQELVKDAQTGARARTVIDSSENILSTYKQPEGMSVDLGLAKFALETAERLMEEYRYEEAFEKAGAVGMLVGMAEMRGAIESDLKEMKKDENLKDKVSVVRSVLQEGDKYLAEASQSFVSDSAAQDGSFLQNLQHAFQKTTEAQQELAKARV